MHPPEDRPPHVPVDELLTLGELYERRATELRVRLALWRLVALVALGLIALSLALGAV